MKRLLLAPLIFLIALPVFGESLDPKILCMRNRVKFDKDYTRVIFSEKIFIGDRIRDIKFNRNTYR